MTANRKKLDLRVATSIFSGFKPHTKVYITFDLKTRVISISRNVIFYEDCFSFTDQTKPDPIIVLPMPTPSSHVIDQFDDSSSESLSDLVMLVSNDNFDSSTSQKSIHTYRRSMRKIHRPSKYKDFHVTYPSSTIANHSTGTSLYPLSFVLSYTRLSPSYHNVVSSITQNVEPRSYNEASQDPNWIEAMNAEIKALELND